MLKVSQLLKFVSDMNPQNTPARLAFFNFLKGYSHPDDLLSKELLEQFFNYCMDYPHWAAHRSQIGGEIYFLLENFNGFYQEKFDLSQLRLPQTMQLVELENISDFLDAASCYVRKICTENDKFRLINDQNKRAIAILLREDGSLEVRTYDKKFIIRNGELEPLRKDLALFYTSSLELSSNHLQRIEVAPYITAQFTVNGEFVTGQLLRGYVYQKLLELKNEPLKEHPRLFFPIKRLEQFFVDRRTDPYYNELTILLEQSGTLVRERDPEALKQSADLLDKAESALENVFISDKLLTLLIRDLHHAVSALNPLSEVTETCQKITPIKEFASIN